MDKKVIWEMAEGKAESKMEVPPGTDVQVVLVRFIGDEKTAN